MFTNDDLKLFAKVAKGNKDAFDILFRKYYAQLSRFAIGYTHDGSIAEELVQDVFIKIWEGASNIQIESSVLAYLYRSVRNACLNYLKHEETKRKYEREQAAIQITNESINTEDIVDMPLFKKLLGLAIGNLPEKCREIFEMAKFEGLSYDEIANFLHVSEKTVENQMGIALKRLRESLLPYMSRVYNE